MYWLKNAGSGSIHYKDLKELVHIMEIRISKVKCVSVKVDQPLQMITNLLLEKRGEKLIWVCLLLHGVI